jgi:hypothetical protein
MNKDPFKDLKNQLDKELFNPKHSREELKSQKNEIITRIQTKSRMQKKKPTYFAANVVIPAVVILLLSVLGSSYLFDQEQVKDNPEEQKDPQEQYTYIPSDELEEQIQKDKSEYQKAAETDKEEQQEEQTKKQVEENTEVEKEDVEEEAIEPENLSAFRYSDIFEHPDQFTKASREGRIYGTSISLGDPFSELEQKYGGFTSYINLETSYKRKKNLLFMLSKENLVKRVDIDKEYTSYKLEQLIELYGDPDYYYYHAVTNEMFAVYYFEDYRVEFQIEGLNKIADQEDFAVKEVDLGSSITSVNFMEKSENEKIPDSIKDIKYFQDNDTLDFNAAWFDAAGAEVMEQTRTTKAVLTSKEKHITASLYFPKDATDIEIKEAVNQLLKQITAEANKDGIKQELWKTYTYRIFVSKGEGKNADYYGSGMNRDVTKPLNEWGYPDIEWFDGFQ